MWASVDAVLHLDTGVKVILGLFLAAVCHGALLWANPDPHPFTPLGSFISPETRRRLCDSLNTEFQISSPLWRESPSYGLIHDPRGVPCRCHVPSRTKTSPELTSLLLTKATSLDPSAAASAGCPHSPEAHYGRGLSEERFDQTGANPKLNTALL